MTAVDAPAVPHGRRLGLFGHVALWFSGDLLLPSLVLFVVVVVVGHATTSDTVRPGAEIDEVTPELSPFAGATMLAVFRVPVVLLHLFAVLLAGALLRGFSIRWRGAWHTLAVAFATGATLLIRDPDCLHGGGVFDSMGFLVPLALSPLLGWWLLRRGDARAVPIVRAAGSVLAFALAGSFAWECGRAWWFEPRWRTLQATVEPVQTIVDGIVDRPDFRPTWHSGGWGGRSRGIEVPRSGRHSSFSNNFDSGEVTAELRWDFDADRPEIVVGGVESAPATALTERLAEVAPSRGWTIRRAVGAGR